MLVRRRARPLPTRSSRQSRKRGGELANLHVGTVDVALHGAAATLRAAAEQIDAGTAAGAAGAVLALRVRSVVAAAVEATLSQVGHALGPAPLAFDEEHARRVADLELYVRQHHAERDLAAFGASILGDERAMTDTFTPADRRHVRGCLDGADRPVAAPDRPVRPATCWSSSRRIRTTNPSAPAA